MHAVDLGSLHWSRLFFFTSRLQSWSLKTWDAHVKRSVHELVVLLSCFSKCFLLSCSLFFELGSLKSCVYVLLQLIHDVHRFAIALLLALQRELIPVPPHLRLKLSFCLRPLLSFSLVLILIMRNLQLNFFQMLNL